MKSSDALVASPQWAQRMNEVDSMAQARIAQAINESRGVVGFTKSQMVILCAIFFGFLMFYSLVSGWVRHRLAGRKGS